MSHPRCKSALTQCLGEFPPQAGVGHLPVQDRRRVANETIADVETSGRWPGKVLTELTQARPFWKAEPERQDCLERYPNGYTCHYARPNWVLPRRAEASAG